MRPGRTDSVERLRALRPDDPSAAGAEAFAVRVLARLAVREAGQHVRPPPSRHGRRALAAAAAVLLALPFLARTAPGPRTHVASDAPGAVPTQASLWGERVRAALAGDRLQRLQVMRGGRSARAALIVVAEEDGGPVRGAVDLLRESGPLADLRLVRRASALARRPRLRAAILDLLARRAGSAGIAELGALLASSPNATHDVVAALRRAADYGRRTAVLDVLLEGARAGNDEAAAAALSVGGAPGVLRILASVEPSRLLSPALAAALRSGAPTVRARVLRLLERGDERALALAGAARLPAAIPGLTARTLDAHPASARAAVDLLAAYDDIAAFVGLGRALAGPAGAHARERLRTAPGRIDRALARRACASARDAPAALAALSARGAPGLALIAGLARTGRLARPALAALGAAEASQAVGVLARLASSAALAPGATEALGRHLARGTPGAAAALLALARTRDDRHVFRVLAASGAAGLAALQAAAEEPTLRRRAREALDRRPSRASKPRALARRPRAPRRARSI